MSRRPLAVGVDGSAESLDAADWAAREALRRGLPLHVLHAGADPGAGPAHLPELDAPAARAEAALREIPLQLTYAHPALEIRAERDARAPVEALIAAAADATLLVLGSRGLTGLAGHLVGSVATAVCERAATPVVLVRAGGAAAGGDDLRPVVVGLDLAHPSDALFEAAFATAAARGVPLRVVHAWTLPALRGYAPGAALPGDATARESAKFTALDRALHPWRHKFPQVDAGERLVYGHPGHQLVKASTAAGLVLVGRPVGAGPHLGPTTHTLIRHAACPVAVVPHD
ncbi:universal stress protein [Streptomyces sp. NPDC052225]|uniref:universal stress protein n=1 Tax=Streptomyces sp. NPDC052225 TaxID=3154949 RepID=UPI00341D35B0